MSTPEKSIALFKTEGSSDKEYRIQIVANGDGFVVNFQNGKRGKALRHNTKTETPVTLEVATKLYDKVVATKLKEGYTENEDGRTFQELPNGKEHSGVRVQLLEEVDAEDEARINELLDDPNWFMQQKHDGERRVLIKDGDKIIGTNREGWVVPLSEDVVFALKMLPIDQIILDAEDMGSHMAVFDMIELDGHDLRAMAAIDRYASLTGQMLCVDPEGPLVISGVARTPEEKRALFAQAKALNQEGLVFKESVAPYEAGRQVTQIKVKFRADVTCQVIERHATKRSASLGVLAAPCGPGKVPLLCPVGNVTLPPSVEVQPGDLIDVRYLYAYEGGSLFQPTFKVKRSDKIQADLQSSLKFKGIERVLLSDIPNMDDPEADVAPGRLSMKA